ncbi:MAG: hypothetical protein KDC42_02100 [Ignavibacteriae bacterium]|nr:hypothetical protein [Ignavibacteriota bacterium]
MTHFFKQIESAEWEQVSTAVKNYIHNHRSTKDVALLDVESFGAIAVPPLDVLGFNRVLDFGINNPVSDHDVDAILDFYRANKVRRFFINVSPVAMPGNVAETLSAKGFRHYNNWAQMCYTLPAEIEPISSALEARPTHSEDKETFAYIINRAFEWPGYAGELVAASIGLPNWIHFIIFDGEEAISAAAMYTAGDIGSLVIGGTLEKYRGKGAQKLLINYRSRKAIEAGCKYLVTETAEDLPERPSPSYRNMIKSGFELAYMRPNWIYEF